MNMNRKLTKAEIIENIHDKLGTDRKDIHAIIDEFFDEVKTASEKDRQRNSVALEHSRSGYARERRRHAIRRQAKSCLSINMVLLSSKPEKS